MKEKAVMPLVISMAIPMTISMLVNSLYNIIDQLFIGQSIGLLVILNMLFALVN